MNTVIFALALVGQPNNFNPIYYNNCVIIRNATEQGASIASGTIIRTSNQASYVLTVRHLFEHGNGQLSISYKGRTYPASHLSSAGNTDLATVVMPRAEDAPNNSLVLARRQPERASIFGYGKTGNLTAKRGPLLNREGKWAIYGVPIEQGDSGAGVFEFDTGDFAGVAWGTDGQTAVVVTLADLEGYLRTSRWFEVGEPRTVQIFEPAGPPGYDGRFFASPQFSSPGLNYSFRLPLELEVDIRVREQGSYGLPLPRCRQALRLERK
jgi:hypothetical protein